MKPFRMMRKHTGGINPTVYHWIQNISQAPA
jgi:hypothetical protein